MSDGLSDMGRLALRRRLGLTPGQYWILIRIVEGQGYRTIAREMGMSIVMVKKQVRKIWRTQCVDNNVALAERFIRAIQPSLFRVNAQSVTPVPAPNPLTTPTPKLMLVNSSSWPRGFRTPSKRASGCRKHSGA
jgi:DNA-binding CsgD family transcriptional regulator